MKMNREQIQAKIRTDSDVKNVLELEATEDGGWLYMIETQHVFPRFVIGRLDSDGDNPAVLLGCGAVWNASERWVEFTGGIIP